MAERLKAAVLKTAKGSQPFVGSNPTSSVAWFFEWSQVWRDGREAEGTGLLNLHIRKGIEGSNPSLSVHLPQSRNRRGEQVVGVEAALERQQAGKVRSECREGTSVLVRAEEVGVAA